MVPPAAYPLPDAPELPPEVDDILRDAAGDLSGEMFPSFGAPDQPEQETSIEDKRRSDGKNTENGEK